MMVGMLTQLFKERPHGVELHAKAAPREICWEISVFWLMRADLSLSDSPGFVRAAPVDRD